MQVVKRNGNIVEFDKGKIVAAIERAMNSPSGDFIENQAGFIAEEIECYYRKLNVVIIDIDQVEIDVYHKLIEYGNVATAKAYEGYRAIHEYQRKQNTSDVSIMSIINNSDAELRDDNSNKNAALNSTKRDLIAGEVSKDILKRKMLPKEILEAWENNILYFHDSDYAIMKSFNCCLPDVEDMLKNGTVISNRKIESPQSFQTACTILTQIIAQISSNQYGGQTINGIDRILAPYLRKSFNRHLRLIKESDPDLTDYQQAHLAESMTKRELKDGVQTLQYQINTISSVNGQTPFVSFGLYFKPDYEYAKEAAMICEEILKQRKQGIKNADGIYTTPTFPKLIYGLDEHNIHKNSPYYYLTELAVETTAKRMYPDYISMPIMRKNYGDEFFPMGCRSFLSPWKDENGNLKWDGRFNCGVVTINLPQIAILCQGHLRKFWKMLTDRLELCKKALLWRHNQLIGVTSDVSPIHWQYGGIARLAPGEKIDKFLYGGYSTLSLGYIGLYETSLLMTGESNSMESGHDFTLKIIKRLKESVLKWKEEYNIGFALYGTPAESLAYKFAKKDKILYGDIKDVTDKGYYTNSYHCDVREDMSWVQKWELEAPFQTISSGGAISYVEVPNMQINPEALMSMVQFLYTHLQYGEFNTKSDYCSECGFQGEIKLNKNMEWECPKCGNTHRATMEVVRRTCGYLGSNFWNKGKTKEIGERVLHI